MSKLKELINELCPDGVEYKSIGELIRNKVVKTITPSVKIKRNDYKEIGTVPIISQEIEYISGYCEVFDNNITDGCYVCFGDHSEHIKYVSFAFVQGADGLKIMKLDERQIHSKFFYHAISNFYIRHNNYERHFKYLAGTEIPIPPLEVQREIVRILDTFTELTAELTTELKLRQLQYEYYRDKLINEQCENVPLVKLGDIAMYSKKRISALEVTENSYVGVDNLLKNKQGKTISKHVPLEGTLTKFYPKDILIGNIRPYLRKIWFANTIGGTNGDVLVIHVNSTRVLPKYLYYNLGSERFFDYDNNKAKGAKMPRGNKKAILNYDLVLPPIDEQKRIVSILDRFDALCNDISKGLPAEIEARQKQYEYYRDKLLTFTPLCKK